MTAILLPVKSLKTAKSRLDEIFSEKHRARLAWAMFQDVAQAVLESRLSRHVVVATSDRQIAGYSERVGWEVILEDVQKSESHSVDAACKALVKRGVHGVLRFPADIPLVKGSDIDDLLAQTPRRPGAILVPNTDQSGTNALLRVPPDAFPSHFGAGSLSRHRESARKNGIPLVVKTNPRIAVDIDTPEDLDSFLSLAERGETLGLLTSLK